MADVSLEVPKWLAISNKKLELRHPEMDLTVLHSLLRSLAQTCRRLRAFALHLLWAVVDVETIDQLGRLYQTLRVSPEIAKHVRSFHFRWSLKDDLFCEQYPSAHGSLLDMAFRDCKEMRKDLAQQHNCKVWDKDEDCRLSQIDYDGNVVASLPMPATRAPRGLFVSPPWFKLNGEKFFQPGPQRPTKVYYARMIERFGLDHFETWIPVGPDCNGEDRLTKSAEEFHTCMTEIVDQVTSLETLVWDTPVATMSLETFSGLEKLSTLKSLHIRFARHRADLHVLLLSY